mmetsp:Transcript_99301/g.222562  ORF Transcript_99301/g.222562 Transcript_99301/m.222562 type:complete len:96 (+) Transcript_99301:23-310(+)
MSQAAPGSLHGKSGGSLPGERCPQLSRGNRCRCRPADTDLRCQLALSCLAVAHLRAILYSSAQKVQAVSVRSCKQPQSASTSRQLSFFRRADILQ